MFINIVEFPPVMEDRDAEFRAWFDWTSGIFKDFEGMVSRRLLEDTNVPGRYRAIVETESEAAFMAMHRSAAREEASQRLKPLLKGSPTPHFYTVVSERRTTP